MLTEEWVKGVVVCALSFLGFLAIPPAQASEKPNLQLDLGRSQDLTVDAHDVPIEQLLKDLGERLNFTVDFSPQANVSAVVNGKFEGSLDEILSEILRSSSYVAQHGSLGITHVVVMASGSGMASGAPASAGNTPMAVDVKSPEPGPVAAPAGQAAPPAAEAAQPWGVPLANDGGGASRPRVLATTARTK
jgi:type II secretory pathway component GspD/PulD (secretin)